MPIETVGIQTRRSFRLAEIEQAYGMGIRGVIKMLYKRHGNLSGVAVELNVSRVTLYDWIGRQELAMLKAQAGLEGGQ